MKALGILGGMGPAATVDFLGKIVRLSGEKWPKIVLEMDPSIPSRTLAAMGKGPDPGLAIYQAVCGLEMKGADVIAVPCNSAHAWYAGKETRWLNMPVSVSAALHARDISRPLILGGYATVAKRLYDPYFAFGCEYPDEAGNEAIYQLIADIKKSPDPKPGGEFTRRLERTIRKFRKVGDAVLLACTELSLVWPTDDGGNCFHFGKTPVFDSSWLYAKAVLRKLRGGE